MRAELQAEWGAVKFVVVVLALALLFINAIFATAAFWEWFAGSLYK